MKRVTLLALDAAKYVRTMHIDIPTGQGAIVALSCYPHPRVAMSLILFRSLCFQTRL